MHEKEKRELSKYEVVHSKSGGYTDAIRLT